MFGAVAVGMFGRPELGAIIALAHYISSVLVGIIFRFHGRNQPNTTDNTNIEITGIPLRAFRAMVKARREDGRPISQLLGDSVKNSMNTILLIGGFIILFSVFLRILSVTGLTAAFETAFTAILHMIGYSTSLAPALVSGLFEIDLGAMAASQADAPLVEKVAIVSAIIAWSGLSVHGQVASIVIESGIRMGPYMAGRLLHAILAAVITVCLMNIKQLASDITTVPVLQKIGSYQAYSFAGRLEQIVWHLLLFFGILLTISLIYFLVRQLCSGLKR
jgi:sporulation integral membrane protein YlbJ